MKGCTRPIEPDRRWCREHREQFKAVWEAARLNNDAGPLMALPREEGNSYIAFLEESIEEAKIRKAFGDPFKPGGEGSRS